MNPFGGNALRLHDLGLVVFPCGGPDGKRPLVKRWQLQKPRKTVAVWAERFADANIGVACGPSGVVFVDVDTPDLAPTMRKRSARRLWSRARRAAAYTFGIAKSAT